MSDRIFISTRKGLFNAERAASGWRIQRVSHLGVNVSLSLLDARDETLYAALDHGHFGVKLQRSQDFGESWEEIQVPKYPTRPDGEEEEKDNWGKPMPWTTKLIWSLEADFDEVNFDQLRDHSPTAYASALWGTIAGRP